MRQVRATSLWSVFSLVILLPALLLAACAGSASGAGPSASPTASAVPTQTPLPIHSFHLGNFLADRTFPNQDGLLLQGSPGPTYHGPGPAGEDGVYFYDFGSQQVITLATPTSAPDGTPRGVQGSTAAGQWIVYQVAGAGGDHWSLFAINDRTRTAQLIDSYLEEGSAPGAPMYGNFETDGTDLIWSVGVQSTGAPSFVLKDYRFDTQQTRVLMSGSNTPSIAPLAVAEGSVLLDERHDQSQPTDGVYLWKLSDPAPVQISTDQPVNAALNDHFAVWDDPHSFTIALYDRGTGKLAESWGPSCIRPAIASDRPYVVCLDFNHNALMLVQAPSGQSVQIGNASSAETGAIAGGRDYWVQPGTTQSANSVVNYIDLPPS